MVNLIVLDGSDSLTLSLCKALETEFDVMTQRLPGLVSDKDKIWLWRGTMPNPEEPSIVLCGPDFSGVLPQGPTPNGVAVVFSDYVAARSLSAWRMPVISCGMAGSDTLTFSSFTSESAVICLQRGIPTLDGHLVEPGEMPLQLKRPYGRCTLMAAVSVFLLTGRWETLRSLVL